MITGAIFDMDGLLFDTEKIYQKIWFELAYERGIELDSAFTRRISGTSGDEALSVIGEFYHTSEPRIIQKACGERMYEAMQKEVPLKKGVFEILHYLRSEGLHTVVASGSSTEQIVSNLRVAGMSDLFDAVVGGTELKYGKPAPHIFLYAAEKIQCDSHDCFVFEDSPNGIRAAHAAACHPVCVPDMTQPSDEIRSMAEFVCRDLLEAMELIRGKYFSN